MIACFCGLSIQLSFAAMTPFGPCKSIVGSANAPASGGPVHFQRRPERAHDDIFGSPPRDNKTTDQHVSPAPTFARVERFASRGGSKSPKTPTPSVVPTYTFPFAIVGTMNLFPVAEMIAVVRRLVAVVKLVRKIARVVGVQDGRVGVLERPDNAVRVAICGDRGRRAGIAETSRCSRMKPSSPSFAFVKSNAFNVAPTAPK